MERIIELAIKNVSLQILKPIITFIIAGLMIITHSIHSYVPTFNGELSKTDLFHISIIFIESIANGLLASIILFLPYLLITILRFLSSSFESSIKDLKKAIPIYYLMVVTVVLFSPLGEANYKLLLLTISLSVCAFIFAHFEKINKTVFRWASIFVIPTLILYNAFHSI